MLNQHDAQAALKQLINKYFALDPNTHEQMSESSVVYQFIVPLLGDVLGWPVDDPERFALEKRVTIGRQRPDITLTLESGERIFVEAKRFGVLGELAEARTAQTTALRPAQLSLPGMAADRTAEEQQAINYAFREQETWAILTNFERLRLFNARRDWLVFSFEQPDAYTADFDLLWQLAYPNILKGSLDRLSNQRYTRDVDTEYLSFITAWRERLARDILDHPAANPWAFLPDGTVNLPLLRAAVQRYLDRLVVVRFAEDHLVIDAGTLRRYYDLCKGNDYAMPLGQHLAHFFRQFDSRHNSALFAPSAVDEAQISEAVLLDLIDKLYGARYRSMPPDIIGNTYEQYLGQTLALDNGSVRTRDNVETRKKQGSYYTPHVIVQYIVAHSLGRYLYATANGQPDGDPIPGETRKTSADIRDLRVLDSACGSGSFLIEAYQVLARFYEDEIQRLKDLWVTRADELAAQGVRYEESREITAPIKAELDRIEDYPRLILETHLYGVDLDPQAAEIAVVNLMMRAMERRGQDKRLPLILNQNVKVGNSLIGVRPDDPRMAQHAAALAEIRQLRRDLIATPHGPQHDQIIADLSAATAALNAALNADFAPHFSDLDRVRPFHWGVEFPEVFVDADGEPLDNPGFTIIIGNPPWEIVKPDLREFYAQYDADIESKLKRRQVEQRIEELNAEDPRRADEWQRVTATIEETAAFVRASDDYTRQGRGDTATHKLFVERSFDLLQDRGRLGYVVPSGIYRDLGTKELREMLMNEGNIHYVFSFSNERGFFAGVHHDFRFALIGAQKGPQSDSFWAAFRFNPRVAIAPDDLPGFLADEKNLIRVQIKSLSRFDPKSLGLMEFETPTDYRVAERIFKNWPLLGDQIQGTWNPEFAREFDMANDNHLFRGTPQGFPLYEGKMIHQFNGDYAQPRYWIDESVGIKKLEGGTAADWFKGYRFAFREVSNATNERTCIATILPPRTFAGHTLWVGVTPGLKSLCYYIALINSFCIDWVVRFKVDKHVTLFIMKSLPIPRLTPGEAHFDAIVERAARLTCTRAEYADLWAEVMGSAWDASCGVTDPAERQRLRDEIDAIVAHLYGLTRSEFDHILGTFPLVFPGNEAGQRRRAALLDTFDTWSAQLPPPPTP